MKKRMLSSIIFLFFLGLIPLWANASGGLRVFVQLDRGNYHANEEIPLHIIIKNVSRKYISFNILDSSEKTNVYGISMDDSEDFITFRPMVYDLHGRSGENIVPYVQKGEKLEERLKWMNERKIVLGPGETFSHKQTLNRIYKLLPDKTYRVRLKFYPSFKTDGEEFILSDNEVSFYHKRAVSFARKTNEVNYRFTPSEIVMLFLKSQLDGNWKRALKYIDLESYIRSYPAFSREYFTGDDYDKKRVRMNFLRFLATERKDTLMDFKISAEYFEKNGTSATVEAIVLRKGFRRPDRFKYSYTLERKGTGNSVWKITGIVASLMKGVSK